MEITIINSRILNECAKFHTQSNKQAAKCLAEVLPVSIDTLPSFHPRDACTKLVSNRGKMH